MEIDDIIQDWSPARLLFFLQLRNIELPRGCSRDELVQLVKDKSDVPILSVEITPYILENLTHQQLINYLLERNYAVLPKAKISPMVSTQTSKDQIVAVLEFALKDYQDHISLNPTRFNHIIPKVLLLDADQRIMLYEDGQDIQFDQFDTYYREMHLDYVLKKFGAETHLKTLDVAYKLDFVNKSVKYLVSGTA